MIKLYQVHNGVLYLVHSFRNEISSKMMSAKKCSPSYRIDAMKTQLNVSPLTINKLFPARKYLLETYVYQKNVKGKNKYNPIPRERMSTMSRKTQYQPIGGKGNEPSAAQEVIYAKEFKRADIAGGYRKPNVNEAKRENPNLQR